MPNLTWPKTVANTRSLIAAGQPLAVIIEAIVAGMEAAYPELKCSVLMLDADGRRLWDSYNLRLPNFYNEVLKGVAIGPEVGSCGTAAFLRQRVIVEDIQSDPRWKNFKDVAARAGLSACWSEPILQSGGEVLGTVAMYQGHPGAPTINHLLSLQAAAHLVAISVEQVRARADLAESRAREASVREAAQRLANIAGVTSWTYNPETDELVWSSAWLSHLISPDALVTKGRDFRHFVHPDDLENALKCAEQTIKDGRSNRFNYRLRSLAGGWLWIRANIRGEFVRPGLYVLHGIAQDITELVQARDAAIQNERTSEMARRDAEAQAQRLRIALAAGDAAVLELDYKRKKVWMSQGFVKVVGRSMTYDEANQRVWSFLHPADINDVERTLTEMQSGDDGDTLEARFIQSDGTDRWLRVCFEKQLDANGEWVGSIFLLQDVDKRKRQEIALLKAQREAEAATEAKSSFLANMSHEIRTPMNGVLGVLHLLKRRATTTETQKLVDEALACGSMLQQLLDDVVDFSKIEAGRLELASEPVDPRQMLESIANLLRPQAEDKGLSLHVEIGDLPNWVACDAVRLRQSLFNLIGNAIKFTVWGSVTVRAQRCEASERLRFEIEDTGIGISQAAQDSLFERFRQADVSTTRRFGGSGLGLAITRKLAQMMGGDVGVRSAVGEGSTFWLEIRAPITEPPSAIEAMSVDALDGLRILVVDDNRTNRMILNKMLTGLGAHVHLAEDGERAVEAAQESPFDLIFMDIQMPGIDGIEATRRIRAASGPEASTPIVALTANVMLHQRREYLAAGMDGVVAKPISPSALLAEIARLAAQDPITSDTTLAAAS